MEGLLTVICGRLWGKKQERLTENLESEGRNLVLAGLEIEEEMYTRRELDVVAMLLQAAAQNLSKMRVHFDRRNNQF